MFEAIKLSKDLNNSRCEGLRRCRAGQSNSVLCCRGRGLVYKVEEVLKEDAAVLAQSHLAGAAGGVALCATLNLIT